MTLSLTAGALATMAIASPASAATTLSPLHPDGGPSAPLADGAVGYQLDPSTPAQYDPATTTHQVGSFRDAPSDSGQVRARGFEGTFDVTVSNSGGGRASFNSSSDGTLPVMRNPTQTPPVGTQYSDSWQFVGETGTWTYTYDFSGLSGGRLPAGAILSANDVDVCNGTTSEGAAFASDAPGDWLQYWSNEGTGDPATVTQDGTTYSLAPKSPCNNDSSRDNVTETFQTTRELTRLTVTLQGVVPGSSGSGLWWELLAPTVPLTPDLFLSKTTPVRDAAPGQEVTYTISAINFGTAPATGVSFSDRLPEGMTFVSADAGGRYADGVVTWDVGDIDSGGSATVHVTVRIGALSGIVVNTAVASASDTCADVVSQPKCESSYALGITPTQTQPTSPASPTAAPAALGPHVNTGGTAVSDGHGTVPLALALGASLTAVTAGTVWLLIRRKVAGSR
ncbi:DUF11 domain-containing protein [Microbacterium sp. SORGH_AS_0888]|uniref:DUF11 domain-containing protein n=1 Tax=Microbacterium sp. SORGH_AS_0888 TaxID=3041791 RepID=UPI0027D7B596|nr:DUF11 domain-containing protein [Microbacterium sp. SORGH_AS_0888]